MGSRRAVPSGSPPRRRGRRFGCCLAFLCASGLALLFHGPLLSSAARLWVVTADEGVTGDLVVVLGGQIATRPAKAAELFTTGRAAAVFVMREVPHSVLHADTPGGERGEAVVRILTRNGVPADRIVLSRSQVSSTREEAAGFAAWLGESAAHESPQTILLVTDAFHSRRARRDFRRAAPAARFHVVSPPHRKYTLENWWKTPEGRHDFRSEVVKYFASRIIGK